jgi:hypothetical protein
VLAAVARRAALSLAAAVLTAVLILGVFTLAPLTSSMDTYDTFLGALLLMLPLVLAGGFEWDALAGRQIRATLWTTSGACLALALLPWPPQLHHLRHGHEAFLVLFALAAGVAARLTTARPALPAWLGAPGD